MKMYLEKLCDELDIIFTHCECDNDWKEKVLEVIYNYIPLTKEVEKDINSIIFKE